MEDPLVVKDRFLRWKFNITLSQYEALLDQQNGVCAICGNGEIQARRKFLDVDHDHQTGLIRGLLCSPCNTALGLLRENVERMDRMIKYVEKVR